MQTAGKLVNLYESENELSKDDFTARRIAEECINIESSLNGGFRSKKSALAKRKGLFQTFCFRVCQDRGLCGAK